jgi:hypothetical protein
MDRRQKVVGDFRACEGRGSTLAAKHHQPHCPWIGERSRAGISMTRLGPAGAIIEPIAVGD